MATFKACVQKPRKDGFYQVYIRVIHRKQVHYIKTDKMVTDAELNASNEIVDPYVLQYCTRKIMMYNHALNKITAGETDFWSAKQIADYVVNEYADVCFSDFARNVHIANMINAGQIRNAKNYKLALQHMERFFGTDQITCSMLTTANVERWIKSLERTARAKEMYPVCIRQIFRAAQLAYNDYDNECIRIRTNPWPKVTIPEADRPAKKAITPEECRAFFAHIMPESKMKRPMHEFARDIAMMILCLAGINTVDLYNLRKEDYHGGIIHYCRAKTKRARTDNAYIEMRVPPILLPLFDKYLDKTDSPYLFDFHQRMTTADSFNANANIGLKQICSDMGMSNDKMYCCYTFRHTWATIAQNDCGASINDVAFAMNHSRGHNVTRGYIKINFAPAWQLNEKVVDFIFFSDKPSSRAETEQDPHFRLSAKYMVNAVAYYNGAKEAELTDIGFSNVDEVIERLAGMLRQDIPNRAIVLYKITNIDKEKTVVYQKQKGKGF